MKFFTRKVLLLCTILVSHYSFAASFKVHILSNIKSTSVIVSPLEGRYLISVDGKILEDTIHAGVFQVVRQGDSIKLKTLERTLGVFSTVKFYTRAGLGYFNVKSVVPESKIHSYNDDLEISSVNQSLKLINKIDVEHYISAVVESESGYKSAPEYYKLQAILCRTYALSHLRRHEAEGFQLCDQVHCQAYNNKAGFMTIINLVNETKGLVVVDSDLKLITAAFHSNCGGQTINSEDVWSLPTSYLKSKVDTFCRNQPNACWKKEISSMDWTNYLALKHKSPAEDSSLFSREIKPVSENRETYFWDKNLKIPLKTVRSDWQLKSTYFSIKQKADSIVITGRGYGHGVGLCQEGAMHMAELNYSYKDILHYYYKNVHLVDLSVLDFFRED